MDKLCTRACGTNEYLLAQAFVDMDQKPGFRPVMDSVYRWILAEMQTDPLLIPSSLGIGFSLPSEHY